MIHIRLTQPTDTQCFGSHVTPEEALVCARNCLDLAMAYARREYPEADVEGRLMTETTSYSNRSWVEDDDDECDGQKNYDHPAIQDIEEYLSGNWYGDALWEPGFDAEAYLASQVVA